MAIKSFKKAVREDVWLKIAISGTSGSGKTYTALRLATGIAKEGDSEIAFISSEKTRTLYYADKFNYDVLELEDYTPEEYVEAINAAVSSGYKIIIIDSLSHGWQKLNDMHSKMPGNSFQNWGRLKPRWASLMRAILSAPAHMIVCSRAKTEWSMEEKNGKTTPTKVGLGTEGDKQADYEYTVAFMLQQGSHIASVDNGGKDNTGLYDGRYEMLTEDDGVKLYKWANSGQAPASIPKFNEGSESDDDKLLNIKKEIILMCTKLGGSKNTELMSTLKKFSTSGNPNAIKEVSVANECLEALNNLNPITEETNE